MQIMDCFTHFKEMPILNSHGARVKEAEMFPCQKRKSSILVMQDARRMKSSYEWTKSNTVRLGQEHCNTKVPQGLILKESTAFVLAPVSLKGFCKSL